ncbi:MAG: NlpC/P60 family protein [Candidatus Nanopelagicales bacterium]
MATRTTAFARARSSRAARLVAPLAVVALVVTGLGFSGGSAATAAPTKTIDQVEAEISALENDAANAAELWNEARQRQAEVATKIAQLKVKIAAAEKQYGRVVGAVDAMARSAYATGGIDPSLQALLADDPQQFLEQTAALDQVARSQGTSLRKTAAARLALAQLQAQLAQQQTAAQAAAHDAANQKAAVDDKIAAAQRLLSSLKADERARLAKLQAQRAAASERKARQEAARATQSSNSSSNGNGGGSSAGNDNGGNDTPGAGGGSPSQRARIAVAYALSKVGHRYVAGADGPGTFDCSGLTMAAWRAAGVSLPHYSRSQYGATRHISRSELRPGDLLFYFGGGAHHVSMYIGGGMMVSASNPRDGVEVIAAWGPWYGSRYSGAGRVV